MEPKITVLSLFFTYNFYFNIFQKFFLTILFYNSLTVFWQTFLAPCFNNYFTCYFILTCIPYTERHTIGIERYIINHTVLLYKFTHPLFQIYIPTYYIISCKDTLILSKQYYILIYESFKDS